ncbi:hypothetical protein AB1K83_15045 [Sporosarcina sp. 179-K 3D1 HS]|uniref:hypothetical protein n=1 Tax=Sporosarcina sp. 179-K 3D1 HS TaxID=3232169 RepID=UPI00399FD746
MKKRAISLFLFIVLLLSFAVPGLAASETSTNSYPLHQGAGPFDWKDHLEGSDFGINVKKGEDKFVPGYELGSEGTVFWHFVNPDKLGGYANITFLDANENEVTINNVKSYKNDQHFGVVTAQSWKLLNAVYYPDKAPGKKGTQFNLGHTAGKEAYGALKVTANVNKQHDEVTWQRYYERDVQDFYKRDVQDFYNRDVQDFYSRDVQDFYERETSKRYVPVFEKKVSNNNKGTTSLLSGNNGGKFNNDMVWLEVDVQKARSEGYTFGIAQSNPGNSYIGYDYDVKIEGEQLIVSFDDRFINTKITAKVYQTSPTKHDNTGAVGLATGGTLAVNLPNGYGDKVYLYVHLENGINWYTTGEYEFVEWRYKDTITGEYALIRTNTGEYEKVKTETSDYYIDETVYGQYKKTRTEISDYKLVDTKEIENTTVTDDYNVEFDLVVTYANGDSVYTGKIQNKGEVVIPKLLPGNYTGILSGDDINDQIKYTNVLVSKTAEVNFNDVPTVIGEQVDIYLGDIKTDKQLEDVKIDNKLPDVKTDKQLEDVREDNKLPDLYLPDKILPDVRLGNETDPYGEYAIKLN